MIQLSHTAKELYLRCPLAYYMHYILNLREEKVGSALPFGSAVDDALNVLLMEKDLEKAKTAFEKILREPKINGKTLDLQTNPENVRYSKSDFDPALFTEKELDDLEGKQDLASYESLKRKGFMFLDQYNEQIMPKIKKVHEVQKFVQVKNSLGDKIVGYVDFICEWEDDRLLIVDNKTSSMKYKDDVIKKEAKQLAFYQEAVRMQYPSDAVAYIVMNKKIRKRKEPKVVIQEIIDNVPEDLYNKTFDEFDEVLYNIRMGRFYSNTPECDMPWGKCVCKKYHESGGVDASGLIKVTKSRK